MGTESMNGIDTSNGTPDRSEEDQRRMIEELHIKDLGVIADSTLPLGPGFTAITGETGAGKTMVVSALGLLMGERSDASGCTRRSLAGASERHRAQHGSGGRRDR